MKRYLHVRQLKHTAVSAYTVDRSILFVASKLLTDDPSATIKAMVIVDITRERTTHQTPPTEKSMREKRERTRDGEGKKREKKRKKKNTKTVKVDGRTNDERATNVTRPLTTMLPDELPPRALER